MPADLSPAETPVPAPAPEKQRSTSSNGTMRRLGIGVNVLVQIILALIVLSLVNAYAFKHYYRWDYTRDRRSALSERTKQFLRSLDKPVKITAFFAAQSPLQGDVNTLVAEYRDNQRKFISIEIVDPYRDFSRGSEIEKKYKLAQEENVVILDCEGRTKIIRQDEMAEVDHSGEMMGQQPTISAFTGEQAVTSGLIEVTEGKKSVVYYIQGHGEPAMAKGKPLEVVSTLLDAEHISGQELNLLNTPVPADATVVMLIGARFDLTDGEIQLLNDYWGKGGRFLVLLDPDATTPRLDAFLGRLGVHPDDDRVLYTHSLGTNNGVGVMQLVRDVVTQFQGNTLIAQQLSGLTPVFPGGTQSLSLSPEASSAANTRVAPLLMAAPVYWGETDYKNLEEDGAYNDAIKDKQAPLYIAATVEKGTLGDQKVAAGASRMIVVGNSAFAGNDAMDERLANVFVSSLNWLLEREALIGIAPKQIKTFTINIPDEQTGRLFEILIVVIPAICAAFGVLVWWWRRRV